MLVHDTVGYWTLAGCGIGGCDRDGCATVACACSGGLDILTRVTRRSETQQPPDRLDTSEYFEQACQTRPIIASTHAA